MPMPTPLPLQNIQLISPLYNTTSQDYDLAYPCPAHDLRNPSLSFSLMPPKSVSLYSPADTLDEDDDDDLPPLVEAPPTLVEPEDEQRDGTAAVGKDVTWGVGEGAGRVAGRIGRGDGENIQYTFASTITPSAYGASSSPTLTSPSSPQLIHASDAPIDSHHGTFRIASPPIFSEQQAMGAQSHFVPPERTDVESDREKAGFNTGIEPPSPSNADAGSPYPSVPSPSFGADSTATTTSPPSLSLTLDDQREPSSGLFRTGGHGQNPGGPGASGGGRKPPRPPSYIPRPPNAFILFRASFVRNQRLETASPPFATKPGVTTGGVSALGPGSVVTIEPSSLPPSPSGGKRGNKVSGVGGLGHGGTTAPTPSTSLSKLAGQIWRSMPADQRAEWERRARVAQAEHRAKYPDWRFRPENASGIGIGTGPGNTFWTGGGSAMGSVPWSVAGTGGGEDWGGAVATAKYKGGGASKEGGGDRNRKRKDKDRDRDREKEKEVNKGKERTGVGTDTSSHPSPDPSSSTGSSTNPRRTRLRSARASFNTSALGLPSWALPGLGFEEDSTSNPEITSRTDTTERSENRKTNADPENTKATSGSNSSNTTQDQNKDQEQAKLRGRDDIRMNKGGNISTSASASSSASANGAYTSRGKEGQVQDSDIPRVEISQYPEPTPTVRTSPQICGAPVQGPDVSGGAEERQVEADISQEQEKPLEGRAEEVQGGASARFVVPLTTIARRSASAESRQGGGGGGAEAVTSDEDRSVSSILLPPSDTAVSADANEASCGDVEVGSSTRDVQEHQKQDLVQEFELGGAFFADSTAHQRSQSSILHSEPGSGAGSTSHQISRSQSLPRSQTQTRVVPSPTQLPFQMQNQPQSNGSGTQSQTPGPVSNAPSRSFHSRGVAVVNASAGGTGGVFRTTRRNTLAIATLPDATTGLVSTRPFRVGMPSALSTGSISPGTGASAGPYSYGQMYGYERGLDVEQPSPPPLSPEVSSPLSTMTTSPTYGSPPFMPFSTHAQFASQPHRPHPYAYAHARSHSSHHSIQHHSQMPAQEQITGAISSMVLPTHHEHVEQTGTPARFLPPIPQPSLYSRAQEQQVNTGIDMDVGMDISMDPNANASISGVMPVLPSGSATTSTLTSVYSTGGTMPFPTHLSSYSSLTGWAGSASPFGPSSAAGADPSGVLDSGFINDSGADANMFSSHAYAYAPYSQSVNDQWYGYDFGDARNNMENPIGGGTSGMSASAGPGVDTDAIAFGPGLHTPFQYDISSPAVEGAFQNPSNSGDGFVPFPDHGGGHHVSIVHGGSRVLPSGGRRNGDRGGSDAAIALDHYPAERHGGIASPCSRTKERRK